MEVIRQVSLEAGRDNYATYIEFDKFTKHSVIDLMIDQYGNIPLGGTSPEDTLVESVEIPKNDFFV